MTLMVSTLLCRYLAIDDVFEGSEDEAELLDQDQDRIMDCDEAGIGDLDRDTEWELSGLKALSSTCCSSIWANHRLKWLSGKQSQSPFLRMESPWQY